MRAVWASILAVVVAAELPAPANVTPPDDTPPVGLVVGAATAVTPLIVGGVLMSHDQSPELEKTGVIVMASGFALAPFVAHGVEGSWRRAAIYGGVTMALSAGAVIAMQASDAFNPGTGNDQRIPMKIFLPLSMVTSAFGVVMSVFDRRSLRPVATGFSLWLPPAGSGFSAGVGWSGPL